MIYAVELKYIAMVVADSGGEAAEKARRVARDIVSDSPIPIPLVIKKIDSVDQLGEFGWDDNCIPYGHDDKTRISKILKDQS